MLEYDGMSKMGLNDLDGGILSGGVVVNAVGGHMMLKIGDRMISITIRSER